MNMKLYTNEAVQKVLDLYQQREGYEAAYMSGSLLDDIVATAIGCKTMVAREVFVNEWTSAYSIRFYNECPRKYRKLLNEKTSLYL